MNKHAIRTLNMQQSTLYNRQVKKMRDIEGLMQHLQAIRQKAWDLNLCETGHLIDVALLSLQDVMPKKSVNMPVLSDCNCNDAAGNSSSDYKA
jgi:hypothetical protein